jgi:hypothetical protein
VEVMEEVKTIALPQCPVVVVAVAEAVPEL